MSSTNKGQASRARKGKNDKWKINSKKSKFLKPAIGCQQFHSWAWLTGLPFHSVSLKMLLNDKNNVAL